MTTGALYQEALSTIERLQATHPDLRKQLDDAYGYAVFPTVGRASAVLGVSFGRGVVFEQHRPIGTAKITELTVGVQVGGQTFSELIFFQSQEALEALERGEVKLTANASASIVKAAASGTTDFDSAVAHAYAQGGMLLELSIGGQSLRFSPDEDSESESAHSGEGDAHRDDQVNAHSSEEHVEHHSEPQPALSHRVRERASAIAHRFRDAAPAPLKAALATITKRMEPVRRRLSSALSPLKKEQEVSKNLHPQAEAVLARLIERDDGLRERLANAAGYAIFPSVGKASAVLGATYGLGEVFEHGHLVGYAALIQVTIGVQLGGDTFAELVIFEDAEALKRFKEAKVAFAANAAAVLVTAGVATTRDSPPGADVLLATDGGMMLEAAIGGQKFVYRNAGLTRGRKLDIA